MTTSSEDLPSSSTTTPAPATTMTTMATPDAPAAPVTVPPADTTVVPSTALAMASTPALPAAHTLTLGDLENTVRNGKKKLYWSAYEVVLTTRLPSGDQQEMRYDAYQVNHNHLKKIHSGAHGASFVRVECKYCKAPRFTQSITVSTKKFEEHYMTLHALDALASANTKKALAIKAANVGKSLRNPTTPPRPESSSTTTATAAMTTTGGSSDDEEEDEEDDDGDEGMDYGEDADATEDDEKDRRGDQDDDEEDEDVEVEEQEEEQEDSGEVDDDNDAATTKTMTNKATTKSPHTKETQKRSRSSPTATGSPSKRARRAALTKDDDDHVAAMQGAAAAVVALSGGPPASAQTVQTAQSSAVSSSMPPPRFASTPSDSRGMLDPQDSDTKRAKKPYWTAFTIVISERVPAPASDNGDDATKTPTSEAAATPTNTRAKDAVVTRETRQDAWRVNHNALRRLHLDATNGTTVRVECRFCHDPKFSQSITVSTRKFEQHYYYEHGDAKERQELDQRIARAARDNTSSTIVSTDPQDQSRLLNGPPAPKRRKSWRMLLAEQENPAIGGGSSSSSSTTMAARGMAASFAAAAMAVGGSMTSRGAAMARHQRAQLLQWFVQDAVPLAACESEYFRAFANSLDRKFEAPSPYTLRMQLTQRHDEIVRAMKTQLRGECDAGTTFALTVNTFTAAQRDRDGEPDSSRQHTQRYMSLSVHFVSREWQRQQLLIACRAVPASTTEATNEQVRGVVASVLDEFGLHADVVFAVTATSPGDAVGQAIQSLASNSNGAIGVRSKKSSSVAVVQLHCAAEALRAVAQAGCHALLHGDTIESLLPVELLWQQDVRAGATPHWMDVYTALSAAVKKQQLQPTSSSFTTDSAGTATSSSSVVVVSLRPHELVFALSVVALLEPFARVADDMSRASYPTIAMVFQYFRHLKDTLAQHEELATDALAHVVAAMQHTLDALYDSVMSVDALLAYVLDPRFRLTQISKVDEKRIRAKLEAVAVAQHASAMGGDNGDDAAAADGGDGEDTSSAGDAAAFAAAHQKPRSLFEELATSSKRTSLGGSTTAGSLIPSTVSATGGNGNGNGSSAKALVATLAQELEEYLSLDDEEFSVDVLQWWQTRESQLPTLARIARQVLALVGTSLPAQEMFTVAGRQLTARRSVLESDTMEAMVVTRAFRDPVATAAPLVVAEPHATAPTPLPRGRSPRAMSPAPAATSTTDPAAPVVVASTEPMASAATAATAATTTSTTPVAVVVAVDASAKDKELTLV